MVTTTTSRGLELGRMSYTLREKMVVVKLTIAEVMLEYKTVERKMNEI
jgi:hypothetical protein